MPYLLRPHELGISKVNIQQFQQKAADLDAAFSDFQADVTAINEDWGPNYSAPKAAELTRARRRFERRKADADIAFKQLLEEQRQVAQVNTIEAYKTFRTSSMGADYAQALQTYSAVVPQLDHQQLAAMLNREQEAGFHGTCRALLELAGLSKDPNIQGLVQTAQREFRLHQSPVEQTAQDDIQQLEVIARNYSAVGVTDNTRLTAVLRGGSDPYPANYSNLVVGDTEPAAGVA